MNNLFPASPLIGLIAFLVAAIILFLIYLILPSYDYCTENYCHLAFYILIAILVLCGLLYFLLGNKYKRDCVLSGSECNATCGSGYYNKNNVEKSSLFGGKCDLNKKIPCKKLCGDPSYQLGSYDSSPWTALSASFLGDKSASFIYSKIPNNTADTSKYSFVCVSENIENNDRNANLDIVIDDAYDDILWNGSSLKIKTFQNPFHTNVSFLSPNDHNDFKFNVLEVRMHNTDAQGGLLFSVTDADNKKPFMLSSSSTYFHKL